MGIESSATLRREKYLLIRRALCSQGRDSLSQEDQVIVARTWRQISLATLPEYLKSKASTSSSISVLLSVADAASDVEDCRQWFFGKFLKARQDMQEHDALGYIKSQDFYDVINEVLDICTRCKGQAMYERLSNLAVLYSSGGLMKSHNYLPLAEGLILALSRCLAESWTEQMHSAWVRLLVTVLRIVVPAAATAEKRLTLYTESNGTEVRTAGETGSHCLKIGGYFRPVGNTGSVVQGRHLSTRRSLPMSTASTNGGPSSTAVTVSTCEPVEIVRPVMQNLPEFTSTGIAATVPPLSSVSKFDSKATKPFDDSSTGGACTNPLSVPATATMAPSATEHSVSPVPAKLKRSESQTIVLQLLEMAHAARREDGHGGRQVGGGIGSISDFAEDIGATKKRKRSDSSSYIDITLRAAPYLTVLNDDCGRKKKKLARTGSSICTLVFLDGKDRAMMWQRCIL